MSSKQSTRFFWYAMALIGAILPLYFLLPWAAEDPGNIWLFLEQATMNPASHTVAADIVWAAIVFSVYAILDAVRSRSLGLIVPIALTWTIGLSCGLPLFFAMKSKD
ncbi:MAG: DUF2834 domain-containing protein [Alphaproteobacteria bacterium]